MLFGNFWNFFGGWVIFLTPGCRTCRYRGMTTHPTLGVWEVKVNSGKQWCQEDGRDDSAQQPGDTQQECCWTPNTCSVVCRRGSRGRPEPWYQTKPAVVSGSDGITIGLVSLPGARPGKVLRPKCQTLTWQLLKHLAELCPNRRNGKKRNNLMHK